MGLLTTLILATPIFGLALSPPTLAPSTELGAAVAPVTASVVASPAAAQPALSPVVAQQLATPVAAPLAVTASVSTGSAGSSDDYVLKLRKRSKIAKIHRTMGIATWAATALAVGAGTVQYRNLYGFFDSRDENPCVTGDAWFRQESCYGTPWGHAITGFTAGGLYFTTLGLAIAMPDPDKASEGDSKFAKNLRLHKTLRWVHLSGMVAQMVLGIVIANPRFGLDRANDYQTAQALATVHLLTGYATFGALTWAGWLML